jgi:hypothetical protein
MKLMESKRVRSDRSLGRLFDMYYSFLSFSLIRSLLPTSIALLLQSQFTIRLHTSFLSPAFLSLALSQISAQQRRWMTKHIRVYLMGTAVTAHSRDN